MTPKRIQRQRTKGWRMPEGAVYVGRPGPFGNPFVVGQLLHPPTIDPAGTRATARDVTLAFWIVMAVKVTDDPNWLAPLRGHDLACWCPLDQPCHADVLLEFANRPWPSRAELDAMAAPELNAFLQATGSDVRVVE